MVIDSKYIPLVSEIHENIDLVLGIENVLELEGVINSWECCFSFLNRSIPLILKEKIALKPKEQKLLKREAPFIDEISGLAVVGKTAFHFGGATHLNLLGPWPFTRGYSDCCHCPSSQGRNLARHQSSLHGGSSYISLELWCSW